VPSPPPSRLRPALVPATGALLCVLLLAVVGLCGLLVPVVRDADASALQGFAELDRAGSHAGLAAAGHSVDVDPYALAGLALVVVALLRGRWATAALLPVLLAGTGLTTQLLKHAIAQPRVVDWLGTEQISASAWPSGHATAAMALALAAVLVAPRRARPVVAVLGGAYALVAGTAIIALRWHFPSDVLGGYLVAAAWALGVTAVLVAVERRPAAPAPLAAWRPAGALLVGAAAVAVALAALAALARPDAVAALVRPSTVVLGAALAALAAAIPLGTSRASQGRG
jgi:membrane-associated phospholipid phosphatase